MHYVNAPKPGYTPVKCIPEVGHLIDPTWAVKLETNGVSVTNPQGNWLYPYSQVARIQREDNAVDMIKRGPGRPKAI